MTVCKTETTRDLAALVHLSGAHSLIMVMERPDFTVRWHIGGGDFGLGGAAFFGRSLLTLLARTGLTPQAASRLHTTLDALTPGQRMSVPLLLQATDGRTVSCVARRRSPPEQDIVQATLSDVTPLATQLKAQRQAVEEALGRLESLDGQGLGAIRRRLDDLAFADTDGEVAAEALALAGMVDRLAMEAVALLSQIDVLPANIGLLNDAPTTVKNPLNSEAWKVFEYGSHIPADLAPHIREAGDFVSHALPIFLLSSPRTGVHVLNGPHGPCDLSDPRALLDGLDVAPNRRPLAEDFFGAVSNRAAEEVFMIGDANVVARGGPTCHGGWQAMLVPAPLPYFDLHGRLHGLKNRILNLQVLHVVKDRQTCLALLPAMREAAADLADRATRLRHLTDAYMEEYRPEKPADWAALVQREAPDRVIVHMDEGLAETVMTVVPGEMSDGLVELVRNSLNWGARTVWLTGSISPGGTAHLCMDDDGPGFPPDRLAAIQGAARSGRGGRFLSGRREGSGQGLAAVGRAVQRLPDGCIELSNRPEGGSRVLLCFRLPRQHRTPEAA